MRFMYHDAWSVETPGVVLRHGAHGFTCLLTLLGCYERKKIMVKYAPIYGYTFLYTLPYKVNFRFSLDARRRPSTDPRASRVVGSLAVWHFAYYSLGAF